MGIFDLFLKKKGLVEILIKEIRLPPKPANTRTRPEPKKEIEITQEFQDTLDTLHEGLPLVLLTGSAGTGKTTFIDYFRNTTHKKVAVVSPTGVAALTAKGKTIHSFFKLPPKYISHEDIKEASETRKSIFQNLDTLIIDEISMVRVDLMEAVDMSLRINAKKRKQNKPFGGVQILMVGDLFQLPPVVEKGIESRLIGENFETPYFFSSSPFTELPMVPIELTKCYRQDKDKRFFDILQNIRRGTNIERSVSEINENCLLETTPEDVTTLTCTKRQADHINRNNYRKINTEEKIYHGRITGRINMTEQKLPSPIELQLKKGTLVMFTRNGHDGNWVNGTTGKIVGMEEDSVWVETTPGRHAHEVEKATWDFYGYRYSKEKEAVEAYIEGSYEQIPLMQAWAMTIHKAQSKTIERLHIDLTDRPFETGQIYVALSRCPTMKGITIKHPLSPQAIMVCPIMSRFHETWYQKSHPQGDLKNLIGVRPTQLTKRV